MLVLVITAGTAWSRQALQPQPTDDGPVIVGERRGKYNLLELPRFGFELEFFGQWQKDTTKQGGSSRQTDTEDVFRGTANLDFEAYVGHKNLLDISGTMKLGLDYTHTESDTLGEKRNDLEFTNLYDVQGLILGEGPVPVTAYSRRVDSRLRRQFFGTIKNITSETGVIARLKSEAAPITLQYFHREEDESDPLGTIDSSLVQDTFSLSGQLRLGEHQRLELDYAFDDAVETQAFGFRNSYQRHDGTFTHVIEFGKDNLDSLRSSLRVYDQSGVFAQSTYRLDEQLRLRHSDRLESRYDVTAEQQTRGGVDQTLLGGSATVRHKLYDSLVSSATAGLRRLEVDDEFTSDEAFINGLLDYTKKVPVGRLNVSTAAGYNRQDNSERGGDLPVLDEAHVFNDPFPVTINRRNIVASSIVVTTTAHSPLFEGLDYTVQAFADRVELRRVLGGAIGNGDAVLVTYDIGPEPGNVIDTTTVSVSARLNFDETLAKGLSLYVTYRRSDHALHADQPALFVLDDFEDLLYGAEYQIGAVTLLAERQNHESEVSPYDVVRFQARYNQRFSRESVVNLEYSHETVEYALTDNRLQLDRVTFRWTQRLDEALRASVEIQFRNEQDRLSDDVRAWDQAIELTWRKRQTTIFASFHNTILDSSSVERTSQLFTIGIRRTF
ncbi:MAG: hypothetical protein AB7G11_17290 [Phycisphaerales bacterium]